MKTIALVVAVLLTFVAAAWGNITTLMGNGPDSNRVKIVICAEGYTASQKQTFINDMNSVISYVFNGGGIKADPYPRYHNFFNVYGLFMPSAQSGFGGYFGSYLYGDRLLMVNTSTVHSAVSSQFPTADCIALGANVTTYCGAGYWGGPACFAAENGWANELLLHESGHSWHLFQDTYVVNSGTYTGGEFSNVNITNSPTGNKWSVWLGYNQPGVGTIGAYNGAYYSNGVYSPASNDKMKQLNVPYDAVCREAIIQDIYSIVKPLDTYTSNSATLTDPISISVSPVDDSVVNVTWTVDGKPFSPANQDTLPLATMSLSQGLHEITALAGNLTPWVRRGTGPLSESVNWTVSITVPEPSIIALLSVGAISILAYAWQPRK